MTNESEVMALRARVAAVEGLLEEHERAASAHVGRMEAVVAELSARTRSFEATMRSLADGVIVCDTEGSFLHFNEAAEAILGIGATDVGMKGWSETYGCFHADGVTLYASEDLPLARAARGEVVDRTEIFIRHSRKPAGTWIEVNARTIFDEEGERVGAVIVFRDISERKLHLLEMERKLAAEREKNDALDRLRLAVRELSTPILEVWDEILAMPVIGVVDSKRAAEMMERVLGEVIEQKARFVILDVTGVQVLDTATADHLLKIVRAVELLGAKCALTGIRPAVAQTLVELGVGFGSLVTQRNLKHGLRTCLQWKARDREQDSALLR
jgi:rsbT co-antagonist protein RsbR